MHSQLSLSLIVTLARSLHFQLVRSAFQAQVKVKRRGDDRKFLARVLALGVDCDVALLTVDDDAFWEGLKPLEFGPLPRLQDSVAVVGCAPGVCSRWWPCCVTAAACVALLRSHARRRQARACRCCALITAAAGAPRPAWRSRALPCLPAQVPNRRRHHLRHCRRRVSHRGATAQPCACSCARCDACHAQPQSVNARFVAEPAGTPSHTHACVGVLLPQVTEYSHGSMDLLGVQIDAAVSKPSEPAARGRCSFVPPSALLRVHAHGAPAC